MDRILFRLVIGLVVLAGIPSAALLARDLQDGAEAAQWHTAISALPLFAVGLSFLVFQLILRPGTTDLLKNLLLAATFLLWGVVQLMPQNTLSKKLGDVVIVLYVTDLAWMILSRAKAGGSTVD